MKSLGTIAMGAGALGVVLVALWGCEDKKSKETTTATPEPDDEPAMLDPELGKVIASASAAAPPPGAPPQNENGPPPSGVFQGKRADELHKAGKPPSVELGTPGGEPRVSLAPSKNEVPKKVTLTVATQMGAGRSLPSVDLEFALKASKPKQKEGKEGDAAVLLPLPVTSKLKKLELSSTQPGQIPKEVADEVAKLEGSKIAWSFLPGGGVGSIELERAAKARGELEHNLVAVVETLAVAALPAPKEPVGEGATWVAQSREVYGGLDMISYRMIRITKVDGDRVTYTVQTRQYASSPQITKAGLPEGGELLQFQSSGTGEFEITRGARMADKASYQHTMKMGVHPPDAPQNQVMPLVLQSSITLPAND